MEQLLLELLERLEAIGDRDESLYDTAVREKMGDAVFFGFVKPQAGFVLPDDYGMPEPENREIRSALQEYIAKANDLAQQLGLNTFHERLGAVQNITVRTDQTNYYDDFFGWCNPEHFDEAGNVIPRSQRI